MSKLGKQLSEYGFTITAQQETELEFYEDKLVEFMNYGAVLDEEFLEAMTALKDTAEFQRVQTIKKDRKTAKIFISSISDQYKGATKFVLADYMKGASLEEKLRSLSPDLRNQKQISSKKQKLIGA